jgi:beta-lactamase class D
VEPGVGERSVRARRTTPGLTTAGAATPVAVAGLVVLVALGVLTACAPPDAPVTELRPDLARHFEAFDASGTFVLLGGETGERIVVDPERAAAGFVPASTFKIFNSLVALEHGIVGVDDTIEWDGVERSIAGWNQDQRMREAFQRSTVWFYQELARRVGEERMGAALVREGYGNADLGGGIDRFWLTGGLRISAHEQVEFLRRLRGRRLGFSPEVVAQVEELMVLERCPGHTFAGKTGWERPDGADLGWLVGWVERNAAVHFYAMNIESEDPDFPMIRARQEVVRGILAELEVLPPPCDA